MTRKNPTTDGPQMNTDKRKDFSRSQELRLSLNCEWLAASEARHFICVYLRSSLVAFSAFQHFL